MITWTLKADNYLLSTLVVGKVKKVCNYKKQCTLFPLMLTTTIQQLYIHTGFSTVVSFPIVIDLKVLYGNARTLYCDESATNTPPGAWFHDGAPLGVYSRSYTIANATFDDDGEYQCRRNGTNVFSIPLKFYVYGEILHNTHFMAISNLATQMGIHM